MSLNWLNAKLVGVFIGVFIGVVIASFRPLFVPAAAAVAAFKPLAGPLIALTEGWGLLGSLAYVVASVMGPIMATFFKR